MQNRNFKVLLVTAVIILFGAISCSKKETPIPYSSINFTIDLDLPQYNKLLTSGNWIYVTGGVNGLIICNSPTLQGNQNPFIVMDRTCTYNPSNGYVNVITKGTGSNIYAIDTTCGSEFNIYNAGVQNKPATVPLKQYNCTFDGVNLTVTN
jgi:Rieske Fe-S protein